MAKSGDWGGNPGAIPKTVKRTANVTPNATVSRAQEEPIQGEAPPLKFFSQAQYNREPFDPAFKNVQAKGSNKVRGSR